MAISKSAVSIITYALNNVAAGTSKSNPVTGAAVNCNGFYGGELTYKITNGTAPTVPCAITFQTSPDSINWYDYYTVGGDTTASSVNSGSILLDRGVMYVRAVAYGNVTNAVSVEAGLQAVTGL